jgi:hypothetical protein
MEQAAAGRPFSFVRMKSGSEHANAYCLQHSILIA